VKAIKQIAARFKLRVLCRNHQAQPISLPGDLARVRNVLVCLPPGQRELTMIKLLLPDLSRIFAESEIYLMATPGSSVYDIFPRKGYRIMTPSSDHIAWSGLASKKYINLLKENNYDVIIDLNLAPNCLTQSVLLAFPGAIRIGKGNSIGAPYYNLEIKTKFIRDEKNIYKSIISTIEKLKSSAPADIDRTTQ